MIEIDCHELTVDEQLALAAAISDGLGGKALAFVKDTSVVLDSMSSPGPEPREVEAILRHFISRRKEAEYYSVEVHEDHFVIRSADPLARSRGRKGGQLPANLFKCPYCFFVTPNKEMLEIHVGSHLLGIHA